MAPSKDRPLRVMFLVTSMPVGGAETLLASLVRGLDRSRFAPEIACLKERGPLGEELAAEVPVYSRLIRHKLDLWVLVRLARLFRKRRIDAIVTVGAGDKMFWGRLAARLAGVPVVVSALHSTGWPDSVGRLNRLLTPLTDAFIGVAAAHSQHLIEGERFPAAKVHTIFNGVDTQRFCPNDKEAVRKELGFAVDDQVVAILAALRPEKNHRLFLAGAADILRERPRARFWIIGDGPLRTELEEYAAELGIAGATRFLGSRSDVDRLLPAVDVLALTSHNEASPVSILEAMSCAVPVVSSDVGSVSESVVEGVTGRLFPASNQQAFVEAVVKLLSDDAARESMGRAGRQRVEENWSLATMVRGYEDLIEQIYCRNSRRLGETRNPAPQGRPSLGPG